MGKISNYAVTGYLPWNKISRIEVSISKNQ